MKNGSPFETVALVGRARTPGIGGLLAALADNIQERGFAVVFEAKTAAAIDSSVLARSAYPTLTAAELGARADVAVVLGGDGTVLDIARQLACYGTPLIGINCGRLGFMTDIPVSEMLHVVPAMLDGHFERDNRTLLDARVMRASAPLYHALALNEVVVHRSGGSGMIELRVKVDGCLMYTQRSDGLIIATPTGSTAYALSSQGPILHPQLAGIVLVPIAPHTLSNRPIVLPDQAEVAVQIVSGRQVSANFDAQSFAQLQRKDVVEVRRAQYTVAFLHPLGHSYYATLRKKLHWNEQLLHRHGLN